MVGDVMPKGPGNSATNSSDEKGVFVCGKWKKEKKRGEPGLQTIQGRPHVQAWPSCDRDKHPSVGQANTPSTARRGTRLDITSRESHSGQASHVKCRVQYITKRLVFLFGGLRFDGPYLPNVTPLRPWVAANHHPPYPSVTAPSII